MTDDQPSTRPSRSLTGPPPPSAGSNTPGTTPRAGSGAHPAAHSSGPAGLALGALGIVFGDIGTSPLYAMQTVFSIDDGGPTDAR